VRSPDGRLAAVDEDADAVAILARSAGALTVLRTIAVGRRPTQALFAEGALWVIERGAGAIAAYDVDSGRRLCRAAIARDPVSMARSADGGTVFVATTTPPRLIALDARTADVRWSVAVPREPRGLWVSSAGDRVALSHLAGAPLSAVDVHGSSATPVAWPAPPAVTWGGLVPTGAETILPREPPLTFSVTTSLSQAWSVTQDPTTGLLLVPMMRSGHHTEGESGGGYGGGGDLSKTRFVLGVFDPSAGTWRRFLGMPHPPHWDGHEHDPRGPVASAWSASGELVVLAQVVDTVVGLRPHGRDRWTSISPAAERATLNAPDGLVVEPDGEVVVHSEVDHAVEYGPANARVRLAFGGERLDPLVARGRRLFLARSSRMAGSRLACSSCHPDGRDDGITWTFHGVPLRTPTLAGRTRAPFSWLGRPANLAEAVRVAAVRLEGSGIRVAESEALAAYIERGLSTASASEAPLSTAAERGRRLFREEAACERCHQASLGYTDGTSHVLGSTGSAIDTPSLIGVSASGPWFHDGRYATLRALLEDPRSGMGNAHALSAEQRDDLIAWMETL